MAQLLQVREKPAVCLGTWSPPTLRPQPIPDPSPRRKPAARSHRLSHHPCPQGPAAPTGFSSTSMAIVMQAGAGGPQQAHVHTSQLSSLLRDGQSSFLQCKPCVMPFCLPHQVSACPGHTHPGLSAGNELLLNHPF